MPTDPKTDKNSGSAKLVHPTYSAWKETWIQSRDIYEGAGGFLDPARPYLMPHPREWLDHSVKKKDAAGNEIGWQPNPNPVVPAPKLVVRRKLARYENLAAAIIEPVSGALFATPPTRGFADQVRNDKVAAFWKDCDGKRTAMDAFMPDSWIVGATFGHAILVMEKSAETPATAADVALPRLCRYTPLDMIDWLTDAEGQLIGVKLLECAPRGTFAQKPLTDKDLRVRVITETAWTLYDHSGRQLETAEHGFGRLPVSILYGRRRLLEPVIGKSVIGDPQLHIDSYNLTSEVRELLRNQTFALLNVPIGNEGSVEREQGQIGKQSGTSNVLFSTNPASFISPEASNVQAYHEHLDRLARTIYRLASAPWESDSRDAESTGSMQLKRQDQQNTLVKYASEVQRVELDILDLLYRALYGPDQAAKQMEADGVRVSYNTTFEVPDIEEVVKRTGELIGLDIGETATKEAKKRAVVAALPNLSKEMQETIGEEIDAIKVLTAEEKQQQLLEQSQARFGGKPGETKPPTPKPAAA